MEGLSVIGVWNPDRDKLDEAVRQVDETFHRLAELAQAWGNWWRAYKSVADRKRGPLYLMNHPEVIRQELVAGQYRHEGRIEARQGYYLTAAAGPPQGKGTEMSFLLIRCCAQTLLPPGLSDVRLELPVQSAAPELHDANLLCRATTVLADIWDPDWLALLRWGKKVVPEPWVAGPALGWINYFPARIGVVEGDLPASWRWFEDRGDKQIFIYERGVPSENDPQDVAAFREMSEHVRWTPPPWAESGSESVST